jgi:transcriptional regulator with PAS, ATPase and Fis domain
MGDSAQIKEVFELVKRISKTDASVLLTGETGTGKELIAGAIHYNSFRADGPFIKVNCATIPGETIESELFGHEVGAFIGADAQKIGQFEEANGGTIFLDEISEMPLGAQEKLLRIIQEKEFKRLGGERPIPIDVRVISATNKDLIREIELKRFRSDLFYRLNMITINLPPLRQRKGDILLLTYFFQKRSSEELNKKIREIHPLALKQLTEYTWPGNIRELENTIERAVLMSKDDVIAPEDLRIPMNMNFEEWDYNSIKIPPSGIRLEELERKLLLQALKMTDWVKKDAAKLLGISERVLNHKIQRFKISHPRWVRK